MAPAPFKFTASVGFVAAALAEAAPGVLPEGLVSLHAAAQRVIATRQNGYHETYRDRHELSVSRTGASQVSHRRL